jgi:hypothetical protein
MVLKSVDSLIDALETAVLVSATSVDDWLVAALLGSIAEPEEDHVTESDDVGVAASLSVVVSGKPDGDTIVLVSIGRDMMV